MNRFRLLSIALAAGVLALASMPASAQDKVMAVQMLGQSTIVGTATTIDAREGTNVPFATLGVNGDDFVCFEMPLVAVSTNIVLGTGVDCLRWDAPGFIFPDGPATVGDNVTSNTMTVTVFSFFVMRGGTLVNFGTTSIQPFVTTFGDGFIGGNPANPQATHMTGAIPNGIDSFVAGTGRFTRASGHARVSGAVSVNPIDVGASMGLYWSTDSERLINAP